MKTKDLLRFNDVDADHEIRAWQEVYLQEKHDKAPADYHSIVIGEGESIHSIAQRMGMKLQCLKELNPDSSDSQGTRLRLR